jgi:hypothetical protein
MVSLGPVSSVFDFLTFFIMLLVFNATESLFQTAWFLESLCTQTFVIFAIRTRKSPFWKSRPSKLLILSSVGIVVLALLLPFTPIGPLFGFETPPPAFLLVLAVLVGTYLVFAELVKTWFYGRHAYRLEQVLIPKRRSAYLSRTARLVQNIVAIVSLRFEDEISVDALIEDLGQFTTYLIDQEKVVQNLQHLRRTGLMSVDWRKRTIKREKVLKEYVAKNVKATDMWPTVSEDWKRLSRMLSDKYGRVNPEYQELLSPKQQ